MSTLYLIRHGQGSFGTENYDQLSSIGSEQAKYLGEYFAETEQKIDRIYCGTLRRQRETADIVSAATGKPPISVEPAFDEYDSEAILRSFASSLTDAQLEEAGWPGLRTDRKRFQYFLERAARAWVDASIEAEEMMPWKLFSGRIVLALEDIMRREGRSKTLIVSTSGGVIGTAVAHVLGLANHVAIELNWSVHNASITRLIYNTDKISLSMFNALPHLDLMHRRHLITYR